MILDWLDQQEEYPKFFWRDTAFVGKVKECFEIPEPSDETYYGGLDFGDRKCDLWDGFPKTYFFVPKRSHKGKITGDKTLQLKNRKESPSFEEWEKLLSQCKQLQKVVLARKVCYQVEGEIAPFSLLRKAPSKTTLFGFAPSKDIAFIGATPEILYRRENNFLFTQALASTAKNPKEFKEKENLEFEYVTSFLLSALTPICEDIKTTPSIVQTGSLFHKNLAIQAKLNKLISDKELIQLLHPTPALGGYPRGEALAFIESCEPFSRGWYGAPIGYISKERCEFAVAIRSCLLKNSDIHLFSGAGIVKGSTAKKEWDELEAKLAWIIT